MLGIHFTSLISYERTHHLLVQLICLKGIACSFVLLLQSSHTHHLTWKLFYKLDYKTLWFTLVSNMKVLWTKILSLCYRKAFIVDLHKDPAMRFRKTCKLWTFWRSPSVSTDSSRLNGDLIWVFCPTFAEDKKKWMKTRSHHFSVVFCLLGSCVSDMPASL